MGAHTVPFSAAKSCQRFDIYMQSETSGLVSLFDLPLFDWEGPDDARTVKETALEVIRGYFANLKTSVAVIPMFGLAMFRRLELAHPEARVANCERMLCFPLSVPASAGPSRLSGTLVILGITDSMGIGNHTATCSSMHLHAHAAMRFLVRLVLFLAARGLSLSVDDLFLFLNGCGTWAELRLLEEAFLERIRLVTVKSRQREYSEVRLAVASAFPNLFLTPQLVHALWYLWQPKVQYVLAQSGVRSFDDLLATGWEVFLSAVNNVQLVIAANGRKGGLKGGGQQPRSLAVLQRLAQLAQVSLEVLLRSKTPKQTAAGYASWVSEGGRRRSVAQDEGLLCLVCNGSNVVVKDKSTVLLVRRSWFCRDCKEYRQADGSKCQPRGELQKSREPGSCFYSAIPNVYWDHDRLSWCLRPQRKRFPRYYALTERERNALMFEFTEGAIDQLQLRFTLRPITYGGVRVDPDEVDSNYPSGGKDDADFWEPENWADETQLTPLARNIVQRRMRDAVAHKRITDTVLELIEAKLTSGNPLEYIHEQRRLA
jgi:hypothetical protein